MELRERRVAQIVRDFLEAYTLSELVGQRLRAGSLDFATVHRLVNDEDEESTLLRLKEECHALFRFDENRTPTELQAEELFDLAVGALFHEAMKFREGFYVTTSYGPRLQRIVEEGAPSTLLAAFRRVFEAGRRRMLEAQSEVQNLFRETRDQLRILLRQLPRSGAVARSLLDDAACTERVFDTPLDELLDDLYDSATDAYRLAIESLVEGGHYAEATALLERGDASGNGYCAGKSRFARGMARYYEGDFASALEELALWIEAGAFESPLWRERAARVLRAIADTPTSPVSARARELLGALAPPD